MSSVDFGSMSRRDREELLQRIADRDWNIKPRPAPAARRAKNQTRASAPIDPNLYAATLIRLVLDLM
jgi:hypothetical protein